MIRDNRKEERKKRNKDREEWKLGTGRKGGRKGKER